MKLIGILLMLGLGGAAAWKYGVDGAAVESAGPAVPLDSMGTPLVAGIKRLPVRFTPTAPSGA